MNCDEEDEALISLADQMEAEHRLKTGRQTNQEENIAPGFFMSSPNNSFGEYAQSGTDGQATAVASNQSSAVQTKLPWAPKQDAVTETGLTQLEGVSCTQMQGLAGARKCHESRSATLLWPRMAEVREYQKQIVASAVLQNTLVSLPTGTGKTLIAAVLMHNFLRWFPGRLVVFLAPSRPLVHQQRKECQEKMGLPSHLLAEMTGEQNIRVRQELWKRKSMVFATPQILENDISRGDCPAQRVVLVVVDEAHKATGRHAMVKAIEQLTHRVDDGFRVLALTATPGTSISRIQSVVSSLCISNLEIYDESDPEIAQYRHQKERQVVKVAQCARVRGLCQRMRDVAAPLVKRLQVGSWAPFTRHAVTPDSLIMARKAVIAQPQSEERRKLIRSAMNDFGVAISLLQSAQELETLTFSAGLSTLLRLQAEGKEATFGAKKDLLSHPDFANVISELQSLAGDSSSIHPKLCALSELVRAHMAHQHQHGVDSTRVMVFVSCRSGMAEIEQVLAAVPEIRVAPFVGQAGSNGAKGLRQSEQQALLRQFVAGEVNTLLCTCIAEEGLDVGEVDLIVEYDTVKSAIRQVQRAGRTGRKRAGRVVSLVVEGSEDLARAQAEKKVSTSAKQLQKLAKTSGKGLRLFQHNVSLLPRPPRFVEFDFPQVVLDETPPKRARREVRSKEGRRGLSTQDRALLADSDLFPSGNHDTAAEAEDTAAQLCVTAWPEWQQAPTVTHRISHSARSKRLVTFMMRVAAHCTTHSQHARLSQSAGGGLMEDESEGERGDGVVHRTVRTSQRKRAQLASSSDDENDRGVAGGSLCGDPPMEGVEDGEGAEVLCGWRDFGDRDAGPGIGQSGSDGENGSAGTRRGTGAELRNLRRSCEQNQVNSIEERVQDDVEDFDLGKLFPPIEEKILRAYFSSPPKTGGAGFTSFRFCQGEELGTDGDELAAEMDEGDVDEHEVEMDVNAQSHDEDWSDEWHVKDDKVGDFVRPDVQATALDDAESDIIGSAKHLPVGNTEVGAKLCPAKTNFVPSISASLRAQLRVPDVQEPQPKIVGRRQSVPGQSPGSIGRAPVSIVPQFNMDSSTDDEHERERQMSPPKNLQHKADAGLDTSQTQGTMGAEKANDVAGVAEIALQSRGAEECTALEDLTDLSGGFERHRVQGLDRHTFAAAAKQSPCAGQTDDVCPSRTARGEANRFENCTQDLGLSPRAVCPSSGPFALVRQQVVTIANRFALPGRSNPITVYAPQFDLGSSSEEDQDNEPSLKLPKKADDMSEESGSASIPGACYSLPADPVAHRDPPVLGLQRPAQRPAVIDAVPEPESSQGLATDECSMTILSSPAAIREGTSQALDSSDMDVRSCLDDPCRPLAVVYDEDEESPLVRRKRANKRKRLLMSPSDSAQASQTSVAALKVSLQSPCVNSGCPAHTSNPSSASSVEGSQSRSGCIRATTPSSSGNNERREHSSTVTPGSVNFRSATSRLGVGSVSHGGLKHTSSRRDNTVVPKKSVVLCSDSDDFQDDPRAKPRLQPKQPSSAIRTEQRKLEARKEKRRRTDEARKKYYDDEASQSEDCEVSDDEDDEGEGDEVELGNDGMIVDDGDGESQSQEGATPSSMRRIYAKSLMQSQSTEMGFGPMRGGRFKMKFRVERAQGNSSDEGEEATQDGDDDDEDEQDEDGDDEDLEGFIVDSVDEDEEDGDNELDELEARLEVKKSKKRTRSRVLVAESDDEDQPGVRSPSVLDSHGRAKPRCTSSDRDGGACTASQSPSQPRRGLRGSVSVRKRKRLQPTRASPEKRTARAGFTHQNQTVRLSPPAVSPLGSRAAVACGVASSPLPESDDGSKKPGGRQAQTSSRPIAAPTSQREHPRLVGEGNQAKACELDESRVCPSSVAIHVGDSSDEGKSSALDRQGTTAAVPQSQGEPRRDSTSKAHVGGRARLSQVGGRPPGTQGKSVSLGTKKSAEKAKPKLQSSPQARRTEVQGSQASVSAVDPHKRAFEETTADGAQANADAEDKENNPSVSQQLPLILVARAEASSRVGQGLRSAQLTGAARLQEGRRVRGVHFIVGLECAVLRLRLAEVIDGIRLGSLAQRLGQLQTMFRRAILLIDISNTPSGLDPLVADDAKYAETMAVVTTQAKGLRVLTCGSGEEGAQLVLSAARAEESKGCGLSWLVKQDLLRYIDGGCDNPAVDLVAELCGFNLAMAVHVVHMHPSLTGLANLVLDGEGDAVGRVSLAMPMLSAARIGAIVEGLSAVFS